MYGTVCSTTCYVDPRTPCTVAYLVHTVRRLTLVTSICAVFVAFVPGYWDLTRFKHV